MKKLISILLLLVAVSPLTVHAANGDVKNEVQKNTSEIVVEEKDQSVQNDPSQNPGEAKIGTDFYLFVDADSAGNVTFWVTDTSNRSIEGAELRVEHEKEEEFADTTNQDGKIQRYLMKGDDYRYTAAKDGYVTESNTFEITKDEELIHIVLRRPGESSGESSGGAADGSNGKTAPKTGDANDMILYEMLCVLSAIGMAFVFWKLRKTKCN